MSVGAKRVIKKGTTRSSLYREADTKGTTANILKKAFNRKGGILAQTEHHYFRMGIWGGTDPTIVEKQYRESTRRLKRSVASKVGNSTKQKQADDRRRKALALQAEGMTQTKIAAEIGITTTRGVRKLLSHKKK